MVLIKWSLCIICYPQLWYGSYIQYVTIPRAYWISIFEYKYISPVLLTSTRPIEFNDGPQTIGEHAKFLGLYPIGIVPPCVPPEIVPSNKISIYRLSVHQADTFSCRYENRKNTELHRCNKYTQKKERSILWTKLKLLLSR